jgi:hypothetical protein
MAVEVGVDVLMLSRIQTRKTGEMASVVDPVPVGLHIVLQSGAPALGALAGEDLACWAQQEEIVALCKSRFSRLFSRPRVHSGWDIPRDRRWVMERLAEIAISGARW